MLNVDFNGRLGADSELKTSKNGNQFLSMRVATDEFNNGETSTVWVNVIWSGDRAVKMAEHMKKGSLVDIHGVLRTSLYKTKSGDSAISHDVFADRVDFISSGKSGATQTNEAVTDTGTLKKAETVAAAATPTNDAVDDLPF